MVILHEIETISSHSFSNEALSEKKPLLPLYLFYLFIYLFIFEANTSIRLMLATALIETQISLQGLNGLCETSSLD